MTEAAVDAVEKAVLAKVAVAEATVDMAVEAAEVITTTKDITETGIATCEVQTIIEMTTTTTIMADMMTKIEITTVPILAAIVVTTAVIMTMTTATSGNNEIAINEAMVAHRRSRMDPPPSQSITRAVEAVTESRMNGATTGADRLVEDSAVGHTDAAEDVFNYGVGIILLIVFSTQARVAGGCVTEGEKGVIPLIIF